MLTTIETYPKLIGYDLEVYEYFKEQSRLCGYNLDFKYPETNKYPTITPPLGSIWAAIGQSRLGYSAFTSAFECRFRKNLARAPVHLDKRKRGLAHRKWKRDLSTRPNRTLDPWYGCDLQDFVMDYALNYAYPWKDSTPSGFNIYNIPSAMDPSAFLGADFFLNDLAVRKAIHAPNKAWVPSVLYYSFGGGPGDDDPGKRSRLATNATAHGVSQIVYSGNADLLITHRRSEVAIQNTTFEGIQGFTRQPWHDENDKFAGIIYQERSWTCALFHSAGHLVPAQKPVATFLREFIPGNNKTGLVANANTPAMGGKDPQYETNTRGRTEAVSRVITLTSAYYFPTETITSWDEYIQRGSTSNNRKTLTWTDGARGRPTAGVVLTP